VYAWRIRCSRHRESAAVRRHLFDEVIVTNTIPVPEANRFEELTVLSVANLLGKRSGGFMIVQVCLPD